MNVEHVYAQILPGKLQGLLVDVCAGRQWHHVEALHRWSDVVVVEFVTGVGTHDALQKVRNRVY